MLTIIEKVIFLQDVDIFEYISTEDLSHIAEIAEVVEYEMDSKIFGEGDIPDAMYMIIEGQVRLIREGSIILTSSQKDVFGTWALFDDEPRVITAITASDCQFLKIHKDDFIELLGDNIMITKAILKKLVIRLRNLVGKVGPSTIERNKG